MVWPLLLLVFGSDLPLRIFPEYFGGFPSLAKLLDHIDSRLSSDQISGCSYFLTTECLRKLIPLGSKIKVIIDDIPLIGAERPDRVQNLSIKFCKISWKSSKFLARYLLDLPRRVFATFIKGKTSVIQSINIYIL